MNLSTSTVPTKMLRENNVVSDAYQMAIRRKRRMDKFMEGI